MNWGRMFEWAEEILTLKPWQNFDEELVFAIQPQADGPVYFASVMGRMGEHHAVAYYKGSEGFSYFRRAQLGEESSRLGMESLLMSEHLHVAFETRENLLPTDLAILKACGKKYRGKWPVFRTQRPARMPWTASPVEASVLAILMERTIEVLHRLKRGESLLRPYFSEDFVLIDPEGRDGECRVADLPQARHILKAALPHDALDDIPRSPLRVEMEVALMVAPINDVPEGEPPYMPLILLVVDADSGMILGFDTLNTREGLDAAFVTLPIVINQILKQANLVPARITARHAILLSVLEAYGQTYGIEIEDTDDLPQADAAVEHLMKFM